MSHSPGTTPTSSLNQYLPTQPIFNTWCTGWGAYDVPRIYDILQPTNDQVSWDQAKGFRLLAAKLLIHHVTIRDQRDRLAAAWQGPAADLVLSRIDRFAEALLTDSYCASTTAAALDSIMSTCVHARQRITVLKSQWDRTTSLWRPFWWDGAAATLNEEAQNLMFAVDDAIRDHRSRITVPTRFLDKYGNPRYETVYIDDQSAAAPTSGPRSVVPPVPGYEPINSLPPDSPTNDPGNGLASLPSYIPAVPGQPVSMLPIPPGHGYAPYGGAYVLPGPGVGNRGYVVPMPQPNSGFQASRSYLQPSASHSGAGVMPMPVGMQPPAPPEGGQRVLYRRRPETWKVDAGVKPIIEAPSDDAFIPGRPSEKQEKAFMDWFTEIAYPWRSDHDEEDQPKIMFRRNTE